jgi:NADH:ubiquinone oxidoreductase subunit D
MVLCGLWAMAWRSPHVDDDVHMLYIGPQHPGHMHGLLAVRAQR